jgi:hypothetical protein
MDFPERNIFFITRASVDVDHVQQIGSLATNAEIPPK